jgi:hypothetical protein
VVPSRRFAAALALASLALAGCGQKEPAKDVETFVKAAPTADGKAALRSIATYRTAEPKRACTLITAHFLKIRYRDNLPDCHFVVGQAKRELPVSAKVKSLTGGDARIEVQEVTAITSHYLMKNERGTWKIDDIVEAP